MRELVGYENSPRPSRCFGQKMENIFAAGNPKHIKAAQEATRQGRLRRHHEAAVGALAPMPRPLVALLLAFALPALAADTASGDIAARTARWHLTPLPEARAAVGYEATFTRAELERLGELFLRHAS